jgi:Zn-finger nucleic acid-binding protein
LQIAERQGVEIDFCPKCRGVWLDRGELDKIIERANQEMGGGPQRPERYEGDYERHHEKHHGHDDYKHHKRKSFLHDLFD